jgi:hypothetical protein
LARTEKEVLDPTLWWISTVLISTVLPPLIALNTAAVLLAYAVALLG